MKAVVAQRHQIEALEQDKLEQNQVITTLESENAGIKDLKKELEKLKKKRVDLIDKTDDYNDQVKENHKLTHEIEHLTTYFKDSQKQNTLH